MATSVATEQIGSRVYMQSYDHDPGATSAVLCSPDGGTTIRYWDMKDYGNFAVQARPTIVGGNGITLLEIVASATTNFSSATQIKTSGAIQADSLNDTVFLECSAEEIAHTGETLRYVAARLTNATGTDEVNVTYLSTAPRFPRSGLTATAIT